MGSCPEEELIRRSVAALNAGDIEGYLAGFSPEFPAMGERTGYAVHAQRHPGEPEPR